MRSRGRSRWSVVQADSADPERGPVAVLSATPARRRETALGRARAEAHAAQTPRGAGAPGAGEGALLRVRAAGQISSRPGCATARLGERPCSWGRRRDCPAARPAGRLGVVAVSDLLPEPAGYAELLELLKARVRGSRVRAANSCCSCTCRWPGRLGPAGAGRLGRPGRRPARDDLRVEFPDQRGWSWRNLHYMRSFTVGLVAAAASTLIRRQSFGGGVRGVACFTAVEVHSQRPDLAGTVLRRRGPSAALPVGEVEFGEGGELGVRRLFHGDEPAVGVG